MGRCLRQNTAVIVSVGPFYDVAGLAIETSLTISNERITLVADTDDGNAPTIILDNVTGATSGTDNDLNYITNCDAGMMQLELTAANTNRVGRLLLSITDATNHIPVFHEFMVMAQAAYDAQFGTGVMPANVTQISGDGTAADNAESFFDGTGYAGTNNTIPTVTTVGTTTNLTNLPAAAATAAELAKVPKSDSNVSWNATALAAINAEVDNALNTAIPGSPTADSINQRIAAIDDLTQAAGSGDLAAILADTNEVQAELADGGRTDLLIDALATATNLSDLHNDVGTVLTNLATVDGIVDNIHDTDLPAVKADTAEILTRVPDATPGQAGGLLIAGANAATTVDITGTITTVTNLTNNTPTIDDTAANHIADHVWDEVLHTAHEVGGSASVLLQAAGAGSTPADIADAVWDEVLHTDHEVAGSSSVLLQAAGGAADPLLNDPDIYGAGTVGKLIHDNLDAPISTVDTAVDGIATTLGAAGAGLTALASAANLADLHGDLGTAAADIAAVHVHVGTIDGHITADYGATEKSAIDLLDDAVGGLADIHTDVADLHTDIADVHTDLGTAQAMLTDIHGTDLPAVKIDTAAILTDTGTTIPAQIGALNNLSAAVYSVPSGSFVAPVCDPIASAS